jgi:hypothetical protein
MTLLNVVLQLRKIHLISMLTFQIWNFLRKPFTLCIHNTRRGKLYMPLLTFEQCKKVWNFMMGSVVKGRRTPP